MNLDLKHLYQILDYSYQNRDRAPGESVCVVVVPPRDISEQFPSAGKEGEDNSPAHCTVAYLGTVPVQLEAKLLEAAQSVCSQTKPFKLKLGAMDIFENDKNDVYHMQVKGKKLHNFRDNLKHALSMNQFQVDTKHPDFKPHITLEYADKGKNPEHITSYPSGDWIVENAWLWGLSEPHLLQFK
jgi:2'-5' RNA ligase